MTTLGDTDEVKWIIVEGDLPKHLRLAGIDTDGVVWVPAETVELIKSKMKEAA